MKNNIIRGLVGVALTGAMITGPVLLAGADSSKTTSINVSASATWHAQLKAIDQTFVAAVKTAKDAYRVAVSTTVTKADRASARVALKSAFASAEATYKAAINAPAATDAMISAARHARDAARDAALATYTAAVKGSVSASAKLTARTTLRSAIDAAQTARANAITALGPNPNKGHK
jgi:hypothetical protein